MRRMLVLATALLWQISTQTPVRAADKRYPDWPCVQLKVPELSPAAVWSGPPIDTVGSAWSEAPQMRELVARLAQRRTPLDEAEIQIAAFITGTAAEKQDKAKLLFSGLFDTLNRQRSEVMNGLERVSRRQKQLAETIRSNTVKLRELQDTAEHDEAKTAELGRQIEWDSRIFDDRRKSTSFACEVPVEIERRLFALSRTIQSAIQ